MSNTKNDSKSNPNAENGSERTWVNSIAQHTYNTAAEDGPIDETASVDDLVTEIEDESSVLDGESHGGSKSSNLGKSSVSDSDLEGIGSSDSESSSRGLEIGVFGHRQRVGVGA